MSLPRLSLSLLTVFALALLPSLAAAEPGERAAHGSSPRNKPKAHQDEDPDDLFQRQKRTKRPKKRRKREGMMLELGLGFASPLETVGTREYDSGGAFAIGLGGRGESFGIMLEGMFHIYDSPDAQEAQGNAQSPVLGGINLSLRLYERLGVRTEAYGSLGIGFAGLGPVVIPAVDEPETGLAGLTLEFGGGLNYLVSREFSLGGRLNYTHLFGSTTDTDATQAIELDASGVALLFTLTFLLDGDDSQPKKAKKPPQRGGGPTPRPTPTKPKPRL